MSRKVVSHESVGERLGQLKGFREGSEKRAKIIKFGAILKTMREREVHLNQTEAASLIGMTQSELSRIEAGVGTQGPSYDTITTIIDTYKQVLRDRYDATLVFSVEIKGPKHDAAYLFSDENDDLKLIHK